jgi:uncharacterized protein
MTEFRILDVHNHVGELPPRKPTAGGGDAPVTPELELSSRVAKLDARGVSQAVVIPNHGYMRPNGLADTRKVNDSIAAYRDRTPARFPAAVGIVEPLYGEHGMAEVDRCKNELGLVGVSLHTGFQGVSLNSVWVRRLIERMGTVGLVPFVHCWGESPPEALWKMDIIASDFPDLKMIVMSAFSTQDQGQLLPYVAERHPNLYFDTAVPRHVPDILHAIRTVGAHRLVYGSDLYSVPTDLTPDALPQLMSFPISDQEKASMLGDSARAVLGL